MSPGMHFSGPCAPAGVEDDPDRDICCIGAVMRGAAYCTCWEPVYDLEQQPLESHGQPPAQIPTRTKCCHDCAYRNGSPERAEDDRKRDVITIARTPDAEFWCHQGVRRAVAYRHPDGREMPAGPGDYRPPIGPRDRPVIWKADGAVGERCAGWAAHRGASTCRSSR